MRAARYAAFFLHVLITHLAAGQGGIEKSILPPPIDRPQFDSYIKWLGIDRSEEPSVDEPFAAYTDRFRSERDAGLIPLREILGHIDRSPLPPPSAIANLINTRDQVVSELISIDAKLLAELQAAAGDVDMSLVLADRKRRFYTLYLATDSAELRIDLLQILAATEIDRANEAVRGAVTAYQYQFAEATKRRHDAAISFVEKIAHEMFAAGFNDDAAADPKLAPRTIESLIQALNINRNGIRFIQASNELAKVNARTKDTLVALLPADARDRFAAAYNLAAYPEVYSVGDDVSECLERAGKIDKIDSRTRQAIAELTRLCLTDRAVAGNAGSWQV